MVDLNSKYKELLKFISDEFPFTPDVSIILGSGLGNLADSINKIKSISTSQIPSYPVSTIEGHSGNIIYSEFKNKKLLLFQGRLHFYEGYNMSDCILPVLITKKLGCNYLILTNASGGINSKLTPGDLMLVDSFNSIGIKKELTNLIGISSIDMKNNFLNCPSRNLNSIIRECAEELGIKLHSGNYWYTKGPSYETPAEIEMIRRFGGDTVGMSTVHEAVFASSVNMQVAIISCITNLAAGISKQKLSHDEVTITATKASEKFTALLKSAVSRM
jgi:purine-nucleoside phosphorylase